MKSLSRMRAQAIIPFLTATVLTAASLAALGPALYQTRVISAKEKSLNNIRVLAGAIRAYAIDNDGYLPGWVNNNPHGTPVYAHNVWDQQIRPYVVSDRVYTNGQRGIRSYSQPRYHNRVLTYGLNGLIITKLQASYTGNAAFHLPSEVRPYALAELPFPQSTIMLCELATRIRMMRPYHVPARLPYTWSGDRASPSWNRAWPGWVDVSPRAFAETGTPVANCYNEPFATQAADMGIARDLYDGGGFYAFCDGHVEFLKIRQSVGIGKRNGSTVVTTVNCWARSNNWNLWNPFRKAPK